MIAALLKDNSQRRKMAIYFLMAALVFEVISIVVAAVGVKLLQDIQLENYNDDFLTIFNSVEQVNAIAYMSFRVLTGIIFILWFRRAYYNVHEIALTAPQHAEGWAAGAWFVPILNLFRPVRIMREIWLETTAFLRQRSPIIPKANIQSLITMWWAFWIIGTILGRVAYRLGSSESLETIRTCYFFEIGSSFIYIPSALCLIIIIKNYGELEEEVIEVSELQEGESDSIFY